MTVDIDDEMTEALDVVERAMRTRSADALTEVLTNVADEVESEGAGEGDDFATENYGEDDEIHADISAAWDAGVARAVELLREHIDSAKFTGWRPSETK